MLRLNGWQRLWVVLSVIYAVPVTLFTINSLAESERLSEKDRAHYALRTFSETPENSTTEVLPLEKRRELAIDKARARLRLSGEPQQDSRTDEEFVLTLQQKWRSLIDFSEIEAGYQRKMEQPSPDKAKTIGYGLLAWVVPVIFIYFLGLSVWWIVRGFRVNRP